MLYKVQKKKEKKGKCEIILYTSYYKSGPDICRLDRFYEFRSFCFGTTMI